ncbi:MAG: NADPH-dependent FMN reductase [Halanaeroarchaeum sp.]
MTTRVAGLPGSLRAESTTRVAVATALETAADHGAETDLIDLRSLSLPVYDGDRGAAGDADRLTQRLERADSVVLGTPVYHGSYSSPLKTALDYSGFDEFENTTVGLVAVAGGSFPITALDHLRSVMRSLGAWVVPHQAAVPNASDAIDGDRIVEDDVAERVRTLGVRVVEYASIQPDPLSFEGEHNVGADD